MAKAIFTTKIDSIYDDLPEERYHFPQTYLRAVEQTVGDWIVYYEPRRTSGNLSSRGGLQSYFATARVTDIKQDTSRPDHYYALVESYLPFVNAVPFREGEHYFESALKRGDGGTSKGAFGRAVRPVSDQEYDLIWQTGFSTLLDQSVEMTNINNIRGLAEEQATFERPIIERIVEPLAKLSE